MKFRLFSLLLVLAFAACDTSYRPDEAKYDVNSKYKNKKSETVAPNAPANIPQTYDTEPTMNREQYEHIAENDFRNAAKTPLSTFGIDVDNASYSNTRRFLMSGNKPPKDAVRLEEFINYFDYKYEEPSELHPFTVNTEIAECPWNSDHRLIQIGIKGKEVTKAEMPPSNIVFLIDISGSMNQENKLPLLKNSFIQLTKELRSQDRVAIVTYAGSTGVVLPSTPGNQARAMRMAIADLQSGGGTDGGAGIQLAYQIAQKNFIKGGNNRVILATDGDFNVGVSSDGELVRLIEEKRQEGVFLSVLGFGTGNYQDAKMEKLADNGNGNYFYIDNIKEGKKVLVDEMTKTLYTIAKDVKLQIEFNPAHVKEYRLIGYENRLLKDEDFNNDAKDAGDLGAGHTVTAMYEVIPAGSAATMMESNVDELTYQNNTVNGADRPDLMTIKLRYKNPDAEKSKFFELTAIDIGKGINQASEDFRFAASVAGFGMLLRESKYIGSMTYDSIQELAEKSKGEDKKGYRSEFISLIELAKTFGTDATAEY